MKYYDRNAGNHLWYFAEIGEYVTMEIHEAKEVIKILRKHKTKKYRISCNKDIATIWRQM